MTSRYYIAGPSPMANHWRGKGVCEVFDDGTRYIHHSQWPAKYRVDPIGFSPGVTLEQLVAEGEWSPMLPEHLWVPQGA